MKRDNSSVWYRNPLLVVPAVVIVEIVLIQLLSYLITDIWGYKGEPYKGQPLGPFKGSSSPGRSIGIVLFPLWIGLHVLLLTVYFSFSSGNKSRRPPNQAKLQRDFDARLAALKAESEARKESDSRER